jgi:hemolysin activation/secretion protein
MSASPLADPIGHLPFRSAKMLRCLGAGWLTLASLAWLGAAPASGSEVDGPVFPVSRFVIQSAETNLEDPRWEDLQLRTVELERSSTGFVSPGGETPPETILLPSESGDSALLYHASAIRSISRQLEATLRQRGLMGVKVAPHPADIDLGSERDLRREGDTVLRLVVERARVRELRTVAFGDRLAPDWRIDNRVHERIRRHSPFQPQEAARAGTTDLLDRDELEAYLFRLNRYPGRRVDAALAPSADGTGLDLDYRVNESKPWFIYAQLTDTGTKETNPWQQRYGFVHHQLSNRDDTLRLEYWNAGFNDVNGFQLSYEAPWFGSERPDRTADDAASGGWLSRIRLPRIGSDLMRWEIDGGWSRLLADDIDLSDEFRNEEWTVGGQLVYNAWQRRALFVDLSTGLRLRELHVKNRTTGQKREELIFFPEIGLQVERNTEISTLMADLALEYNLTTLSASDGTAQILGRPDPDEQWPLLRLDLDFSHYLEPLLNRRNWEDPSSPGSSTLAHEIALGVRGQYAFDYRLIPQATEIAGGYFSVRGYPQSTAVGDSLVIGTLEYRFHLPNSLGIRRTPTRVPVLGDFRVTPDRVYGRADWDLILRAFVDAARTARHDRSSSSTERNQTLIGVGVGLELQFRGKLKARVDWGRAVHSAARGPLDEIESGNNEFHFLFEVLY